MDYGKYTGQVGYALYQKTRATQFAVYYAHPGSTTADEPHLLRPTPFFGRPSAATTLSYVDLAVLDTVRQQVVLIAEIEESGGEPKKILGDLLNITFAEGIRISKEDFGFAVPLVFLLGLYRNARGGGIRKAERLVEKQAEVNRLLGRQIEIRLVMDADPAVLAQRVQKEIETYLV